MRALAGFPYAEIEFDKQAGVAGGADVAAWQAALPQGTDVLVLSHGWNNDMDRARELYAGLARELRTVLDGASAPDGAGGRSLAILGVLWPSKRWADSALSAGGAASAAGELDDVAVEHRLDEQQGTFTAADADAKLAEARALVAELEDDPDARDAFVAAVREAVAGELSADEDDLPPEFESLRGDALLKQLKAPVAGPAVPDADGGAASLSFSGFKAAAERFLNTTTYYQMKARAGKIGAEGLHPLLSAFRDDLRLHLVGHSFGGRLVAAATLGPDGAPALRPCSVTLLQAAFSHFGFSADYDGDGTPGFFRRVVEQRMTRGPIVVTHSVRDRAVGYAYPIASRLGGQASAGLGDAASKWGGIGRNGAQRTAEADAGVLVAAGDGGYAFKAQRVTNLNADDVILDHSDICRPEVAYAILSAVAVAP